MHARIANNINHEFEWFLNNHPDFSGRHHPQRKACVFVCSPVSIANGDHDAKNLPVLTADRLQLIQQHTRGYHYYTEDLYKNMSRPPVWFDMQTFGQYLIDHGKLIKTGNC